MKATSEIFFDGPDVAKDISKKYGHRGELLKIFANNKGKVVDKWHHYIPIYERYFGPYRKKPLRFLEIGVFKGGSLEMWRKYFGPDATIFGIDIDPACAAFNGSAGQVRIGSQDDAAFLADVVAEMGGVDIVLDDGSHMMAHVRASLKALFPMVADNGLYMIEDLHTAYWRRYGGGMGRGRNFFGDVLSIVHDMHHWYRELDEVPNSIGSTVSGVHIHDSIVVLEKGPVYPPVRSQIG